MSQTPPDPHQPDDSRSGQPVPPPGTPDYGQGASASGPDYGAPPPYPTAPGSPGQQPSQPAVPPPASPYGQPAPNPYAPGAPASAPYGQAPYGQAPYGQAPYGQAPGGYGPAYGGPAELPPSKGMAITALILSLLFCIPVLAAVVAIVLAVIVLRRSRDGRNHGKGLAIAALVIAPLVTLGWIGVGIASVAALRGATDVNSLSGDECLDGVNGKGEFTLLRTVDCGGAYDAKVLGVLTLTDAQAADLVGSPQAVDRLCGQAVDRSAVEPFIGFNGAEVLGITNDKEPSGGDKLACIVHLSSGEKLR
ncbi:hypothetical protein K8Z61_00930 [Nocardioides sp. TRM66260-LWL]|uniref:hypothetical protein n=1 Tax=Nocardioides sp. TRM66260-LWL TaxID=2874478 RepID=UPI001CC4952C|nr:hypothetical protein [Nocardioides sp. TRM66260-LWL]MBZ5733047.1 hypothetical protein [Nocardioides sp. TRM66260-LWL]